MARKSREEDREKEVGGASRPAIAGETPGVEEDSWAIHGRRTAHDRERKPSHRDDGRRTREDWGGY